MRYVYEYVMCECMHVSVMTLYVFMCECVYYGCMFVDVCACMRTCE